MATNQNNEQPDDPIDIAEQYERKVAGGEAPETVAELLSRYSHFIRGECLDRPGQTTHHKNVRDACRAILYLYWDKSPRDIGPIQMRAVQALLIERGLAKTTIDWRINQIVGAFKWAAHNGWLERDHHLTLRIPGVRHGRAPGKKPRQVTEVNAIELVLGDSHLRDEVKAMLQVQLFTGCRPGEACRMRGGEIDTEPTGNESPHWVWCMQSHKNAWKGKRRRILIGPRCQRVILPYLRDDYLFRTPKGNVYRTSAYRQAIQRACERQSVPVFTPQEIRRRVATEALKSSGIRAAQETLGHSTQNTTEQYLDLNAMPAAEKFVSEWG